ncbi:MAG TPA: hypothetical protein VIT93_02210, partial [Dehalococcoidia bacterium]
VAALSSEDSNLTPVPPSDSPSPTTQTAAPTPTSTPPVSVTDRAWIDAQLLQDDPLAVADILWDTALATDAAELAAAAQHITQAVAIGQALDEAYLCPILDYYNSDFATGRAGEPACGDEPVVPTPTDDLALALWANETRTWRFGDLPAGAATYDEGDDVPFLLTWTADPGEEYSVEITYDCRVGGGPAIDFLAGVELAEAAIFEAASGPGANRPDAAVPLPDTPDLDIDDGTVRLLYFYGGNFLLLPQGPDPADRCEDERTISVPVRADADELTLMGSVRLADSGDHGGRGDADATVVINLSASVSKVGTVTTGIQPGVIAP